MPTKRKRLDRRRIPAADSADVGYLLTGDGTPHAYFIESFARELWEHFKDALLADWIATRPGTRPWAWWKYDAPRWHDEEHEGWRLSEPRQRLGGTGTPVYERLNEGPCFRFGIPDRWIDELCMSLWPSLSGLGIDPDNPPAYE